jgi:hypothetical protein
VISESSVADQVAGMEVDLEVPQHQLMAEASVAPLPQLLTVELLPTAVDMAVVGTETHQEVAAANLGGKLHYDGALFLFGQLSTLVQFIDLGQRRQTDVGCGYTTSFLSGLHNSSVRYFAFQFFIHATHLDFLVAAPSRRRGGCPMQLLAADRVFDHRTAYDR